MSLYNNFRPRFRGIICDKALKCNQQDEKDVKGHIDILNHKSPVTNVRIMFKYGVSSGPYFPVFSPNMGNDGPEKNSVFGQFSRSGHLQN